MLEKKVACDIDERAVLADDSIQTNIDKRAVDDLGSGGFAIYGLRSFPVRPKQQLIAEHIEVSIQNGLPADECLSHVEFPGAWESIGRLGFCLRRPRTSSVISARLCNNGLTDD